MNIVELLNMNMDVVPLAIFLNDVLPDIRIFQPDVRIFSPFSLKFDNILVENRKFYNITDVSIAIGQNLLSRGTVSIYISKHTLSYCLFIIIYRLFAV